ncbi:putative hydroquinone glucosyltransferase [Dioscorea sansibarensis]
MALRMANAPEPRITIFSSPGMGHIIPVGELSKWLVNHHNLSVTLITQTVAPISNIQQALLNGLSNHNNIDIISLQPPPPPEILPNDTKPENLIFPTIKYNTSFLRDILTSLAGSTTPLVALVVYLLGAGVFHIAKGLSIEPYMFFTSTAMLLAFSFRFPSLDANFQGSEAYKGILWLVKQYTLAKGILVNSFNALECAAVEAFKEDQKIRPAYAVGPMVWSSSLAGEGDSGAHRCLKWLDEQPKCSVLIWFGNEPKRFLRVAKSPDEMVTCGTYFGDKNQIDPLSYLPEGFLERNKELGFVVPSWDPQVELLSHVSTGGFLTHHGWNSVLEGIVKGVPLIVWPLHAEQKMNAVFLVDGVKVGLRPRVGESGVVERDEICSVIKYLFEGEEEERVRAKAREVSGEAARALEDDGTSFETIS